MTELVRAFPRCTEEYHMLWHSSFFLLRFQRQAHSGGGRAQRARRKVPPGSIAPTSRAEPLSEALLPFHSPSFLIRDRCTSQSGEHARTQSRAPRNRLPRANRGRKFQATAPGCVWVPRRRPLPWPSEAQEVTPPPGVPCREGSGVAQPGSLAAWGRGRAQPSGDGSGTPMGACGSP